MSEPSVGAEEAAPPAGGDCDPGESDAPEHAEVVGREVAGVGLREVAARFDALASGELRAELEPCEPLRAEIEATGKKVRVLAHTARTEVLAAALQRAGARYVEVRLYPSAEERAAWTDFGREEGVLPEGVRAELVGALGPRPRFMGPMLAALLIALCLERLGVVPLPLALVVMVVLGLMVLLLGQAAARSRIEWIKLTRSPEDGTAAGGAHGEDR